MEKQENVKAEDIPNKEELVKFQKLSNIIIKLEDLGMPIKNASYGKVRVEYVRGDDFAKTLKANLQTVCKDISTILGKEIDPDSSNALQQVYSEFNKLSMMVKAVRFTEDGKVKYPKRLAHYEEFDDCCGEQHEKVEVNQHELKNFDEKMFYVLDLNRGKGKVYFWLFVVIAAVLMYCLFPVWPYEVKVGIWWVSYILLNLMLGLIAVRLVLFCLLYTLGIDFWLFPNLHDDKLGVIDSFKPLYSVERRKETTLTLIFRLSIFVCIGYLAYHVYQEPNSVQDLFDHVVEVYFDVFDWGKEKIVNYGNSTAINLKNQKYMNPNFNDDDDL
jgi:translocation protein SEC62